MLDIGHFNGWRVTQPSGIEPLDGNILYRLIEEALEFNR